MSTRLVKTRKPNAQRISLLVPLSVGMIIAALGMLIYELAQFSQAESRIPITVSVAGVPVGGLLPRDAVARWEDAYDQPITLSYEGSPILLSPDRLGFRINSATMMAEAMAAAEAGEGFWARFTNHLLGNEVTEFRNVPLVADYQQSALEAFLRDVAARYDQAGSDEGVLDVQTLTIRGSSGGTQLDVNAAIQAVDRALRSADQRVVELPVRGGIAGQAGIASLERLIIAYLDSQGFIYDGQSSVAGIYIQDLTTGEEINIHGNVAFTAASTAKVPILIDYFRILDREPNDDDKFLMGNSLLCSANSTSNLILRDIIGAGDQFRGLARVLETTQALGVRNTFLTAPFADGSPGQIFGSIPAPRTAIDTRFNTAPDPFNQTTAADMGTLFNLIYDCARYESGLALAFPNGEFTASECQQMIELMSANDLQRLLQGGIPRGARISHKNGWLGETAGEAGIVFPPNGRDYIISVFLWKDTNEGFQDYELLWPLIEGISRAAWNYFVPELALTAPRADLPRTAEECFMRDAAGNITYNYLPPYGQVNLQDINGWRRDRVPLPPALPQSN